MPLSGDSETVQLTETQFRACLAALAKQAGSMAELAARVGVSGQFMGDVIAGRKRAGDKLLSAFGAREVRMIELPLCMGLPEDGQSGIDTVTE